MLKRVVARQLTHAVLQDSGEYAGYEEVLKNGADAIGQTVGGRRPGGGTKRVSTPPASYDNHHATVCVHAT